MFIAGLSARFAESITYATRVSGCNLRYLGTFKSSNGNRRAGKFLNSGVEPLPRVFRVFQSFCFFELGKSDLKA